MSKYPLLPAYVIAETVRALLTFSAVESQIPLSSVLIAFYGEITKLAVALIFLARSNDFKKSTIQTELLFSSNWRQYMAISVPAVMYLVNFLLYIFALRLTTPAILHVVLLAKLPITALLHHLLVTPQQSFNAWISLGFITLGMLLFNLPSRVIVTGAQVSELRDIYSPSTIGTLIGLLIALVSGFISTYTEIILKQNIPFWVTQTWLYAFGSLASAMVLCFWEDRGTGFSTTIASIALQSSVVVAVAINGLVVANILRKNDNLVKIVGSSASIVVIVVAQWVLFSDLRATTITMQTVAGLGITSISTWTYNHYKQTTTCADKQDGEERKTSGMDSTFLIPRRRKILWLCAAVAQITFLAGLLPFTKSLDSLKQPNTESMAKIDVARFFVPHNIAPTPWAPGVNPPRCAWDHIVQNNITTLSREILNWEVAYLNSGCPVFPIPDGGFIFHLYWRGPWRTQNDFAIEAFLATQRLRDGHRIIFWYHDGGPPSSTREYLRQYSNYVEFREADLYAESQGTCLTQKLEWTDASYQESVDMPVQALSDMFRTLLLAKYGGIWIDADIILLRDLTSLIRMGPATVGVPDSRNYNNPVLIYGPASGGVGAKVLRVLCGIPYDETEFRRMWPASDGPYPWHWMYNSELSKICEHHEGCGIGLLPAMWTDGMFWGSEGQSMIWPCEEEDKFGEGTFPIKFRGVFTLHSRLDNENDSCVEDGSITTAGRLRKLVRTMLAEGLDLDGRDIFPPRLWYDY